MPLSLNEFDDGYKGPIFHSIYSFNLQRIHSFDAPQTRVSNWRIPSALCLLSSSIRVFLLDSREKKKQKKIHQSKVSLHEELTGYFFLVQDCPEQTLAKQKLHQTRQNTIEKPVTAALDNE